MDALEKEKERLIVKNPQYTETCIFFSQWGRNAEDQPCNLNLRVSEFQRKLNDQLLCIYYKGQDGKDGIDHLIGTWEGRQRTGLFAK